MSDRPLTFADPGRFEIYCHYSPPMDYPEEAHGSVQVCIPQRGAAYSVTRQSEGGSRLVHRLGARDILIIPAGQPHAVAWRRPAEIVSLQLYEPFLMRALGAGDLRLRDATTLRDPFISVAGAQLLAALHDGDPLSPAFAEAIAIAVAYRVAVGAAARGSLAVPRGVPTLTPAQLVRISRYVDERIDEPIRLAELATQLELSPWHFLRRFTASEGQPPHAFIAERRLVRAQELLAASELSITEIALEVGMSHSHFSRRFLKRFGVSPREFRRQRRS